MLQTLGILTYTNKDMGNPCSKKISDKDFLKHMIPHHQVAVDMSKAVLKHSSNPQILYLARNIIFKQSDEILLMENMLLSSVPDLSSKDRSKRFIRPTSLEYYYPDLSQDKNAKCGLNFFDPEHHHAPVGYMSDEAYLKHMIPHHQVAVDMSKNLLKRSNNPLLISFCYDVVLGQESEIMTMKLALDCANNYYSKLIS